MTPRNLRYEHVATFAFRSLDFRPLRFYPILVCAPPIVVGLARLYNVFEICAAGAAIDCVLKLVEGLSEKSL